MDKKFTYLPKTFSKDEEILGAALMHWFCYVLPTISILIGIVMLFSASLNAAPIGVVLIIFGGFKYLSLQKTEMAVTNKRVIYKTGILAVKTVELRNEKVESVSIDQTIFGRIFGYADIRFTGTGASFVKMPFIVDPISVKSKFEDIIEKNSKK